MSEVARKRDVLASLAALLGGLMLIRLVACGPIDDRVAIGLATATTGTSVEVGTGLAGPGTPSTSFAIDGDLPDPIAPGTLAPLDLELTNPYDHPITVADLSVSVLTVSAPNADQAHPCGPRDFAVDQVPTGVVLTLAAGQRGSFSTLGLPTSQWPRVGLADQSTNQDGCKGASLTLRYTSTGTRPR
jgi:hypothetical protein